MRSIQLLVSVLLTASITAYVTYKKHDQIEEIIDPPRVSIFSNITIGDTCGVQKNFFEVVDLDLGVRVPVRRGKARIKTFEGNQIQLQISSQFKSVYIDVPPKKADTSLTLELVCNDDQRLRETLDSIKRNF